MIVQMAFGLTPAQAGVNLFYGLLVYNFGNLFLNHLIISVVNDAVLINQPVAIIGPQL